MRSNTCSDLLISLLACSSGELKIVAALLLLVRTPEAVDRCHSWLVFLPESFSGFALVRIDSLAPELTGDLNSRVLDCLFFLTAEMTSLTKIIGLKCTCFSLLLDFICLLFLLVFFHNLFNMWKSCNSLSKLLVLSVCYIIFDLLLGFNLSIINASLQSLSQLFSLLLMELLLLSSYSAESESYTNEVLWSSSGELSSALFDEELISKLFEYLSIVNEGCFFFSIILKVYRVCASFY